MNKYSKSIIYAIRCNTTDRQYIGSTIQGLRTRISKHEADYRGFYQINGNKHRDYRSSFPCMENDNYEIYKIEDYPCENVCELEIREGQHVVKAMAQGWPITNKNIPKGKLVRGFTDFSTLPELSCRIEYPEAS